MNDSPSMPQSAFRVKDPLIGNSATCDHCGGAGGSCSACEGKGFLRQFGTGWITYAMLAGDHSPLSLSNLVMALAVSVTAASVQDRRAGRLVEADLKSKEAARLHAVAKVLTEMKDNGPPTPEPPAAPAGQLRRLARRFFGGRRACA